MCLCISVCVYSNFPPALFTYSIWTIRMNNKIERRRYSWIIWIWISMMTHMTTATQTTSVHVPIAGCQVTLQILTYFVQIAERPSGTYFTVSYNFYIGVVCNSRLFLIFPTPLVHFRQIMTNFFIFILNLPQFF